MFHSLASPAWTMAGPIVLNVAEKPSVARALAEVFRSSPGAQPRNNHPNAPVGAGVDFEPLINSLTFECRNPQLPDANIRDRQRAVPLPEPAGERPHRAEQCARRGAHDDHHRRPRASGQSGASSGADLLRLFMPQTDSSLRQDFPSSYGWSKVNPVALFDAPINTMYDEDKQPLERMLRDLARRASALILWLDCDREGEAISDEVRTVCLQGNARLGSQNRIFRAKFSTVMPGEIQRALRTLGRVNENLVKAVEARTEHDLRECQYCSLFSSFLPSPFGDSWAGVGAAFTRFMTKRFRKKFDGFAGWSLLN